MKKKLFYTIACILSLTISSCQYDDAEVWDAINNQEKRIADLEEWQKTTNDNIAALQAIVNGSNDYITSVEELKEGDEVVGYTINFHRQGEVTIYNGKKGDKGDKGDQGEKGDDAITPVIGVLQGEDGRWYWTVNGELMKDANGNPVCASGKDGEDGVSPTVVTPMVKLGYEIGDEYYPYASYLSVDNGETWTQLTVPLGWQGNCLESINDFGDYFGFNFYSSENGYYSSIYIPKYGIKLSFSFYMMDNVPYNGQGIFNGKYKVPQGMPFKIMVHSNEGEWSYKIEDGAGWNFSREGNYLICSSVPEGSAILKFEHYSENNELTYFQIRLTSYVMKTMSRSDNPELFDELINWYGNIIVDEAGNIKAIPVLANTQYINLSYRNLTSLKGLEILEGLESLECSDNQLTELDFSALPNLKELYCNNNQLTELDLSALPDLKELYCNSNQLTELNVTSNLALERISCMSNQLKSIDVSNNMNLYYLELDNNMIESLDISKNTALQTLWIPNNRLTNLDVSSNPDLSNLYCQYNQLRTLDISDNLNLYNLTCGNQMDEAGNSQTLILTIDELQRERWDNLWQYNEINNNVSLAQ